MRVIEALEDRIKKLEKENSHLKNDIQDAKWVEYWWHNCMVIILKNKIKYNEHNETTEIAIKNHQLKSDVLKKVLGI